MAFFKSSNGLNSSVPADPKVTAILFKVHPLLTLGNSLWILLKATPRFIGSALNTVANIRRWARSRSSEESKRKIEAARQLEEAAVTSFLNERGNLSQDRFHVYGPKGFITCANELETLKKNIIEAGYVLNEKHLLISNTNAETG